MKRILLGGMLCLLMGISCTHKVDETAFITDCEKSMFVKTPRLKETMEYFQKLADFSSMVKISSFGTSPQGRGLPLVIVDKDGLQSPDEIRRKGRVIILIESCIHAGEPDGKDASMIFLRDMLVKKQNIDLLDDVSFLFIPIFYNLIRKMLFSI